MGARFVTISGGTNCSKGNPEPTNFTLLRDERIGDLWVSVAQYHGCTNYEGKKILVTRENPNTCLHYLDPHFSENHESNAGLLARFEPTDEGLTLARMFARMYYTFKG